MEFNQVRYFLTLASTLNFTRAAEACNVTQPALTRAIQKLEEELGGLLFYRERNLTQLTELGQVVLPLLAQTSAAAQAARDQALTFKRRESSPLRVGIDHSVAASVLTPVLGEMVTRISAFEPTIRQYSSPEIYRLLLEGTIDAGLVVGREEMPERLNRWKLYDERLVALCPAKHAIAKLEEVTVACLADERILGREIPDCAIHAAIQGLCASLGIEWRIHRSGSEESQLYEMVKASLGIAVVGERRPVPQGLVACPLAEIAPQSIMLAVIAGRQHGPSVTIFLKLMRARDWAN